MEKNNFKYILISHRYQLVSGIVMISAGILTGVAAERSPSSLPQPPAAAIAVQAATPPEAAQAKAAPRYATMAEATPAEPEAVLLPDRLNLAYMATDGSEGGPGAESMAQQLAEELAAREAGWTSEIYDLYNQRPIDLGTRLGIKREALLGNYNPQDPDQNPLDPSTWVVPEFKNIHVTFLDGNGVAGASRSNLKEIIAMASVYNYYGNAGTLEELKEYAMDLWEASHHYSYQVSPVYYCEGCQEADGGSAAGTADAARAEESGGAAGAAESGAGLTDENQSGYGSQIQGPGVEAGTGGDVTEPDAASAETAAGSAGTASAAAETASATAGTGATLVETAADSGGPAAVSAEAAEIPAAGGTVQESQAETSVPGEAEKMIVEGVDGGPGVSAPLAEETVAPAEHNPSPLTCPGHVDLAVQITIAGIDGNGSLFMRDSHGAASAGSGDSRWPGWNDETMGYVRTLCSQDWFQEYGLTVTDLVVRNPLTSEDINLYMDLVPSNASKARKDLVRYALNSVGRVPYYWGGKPGSMGYEGNQFGIVVSPDEDGRFLKGLDCSGWISWVYWSVTGDRLPGESTVNQIHCGKAISKEELQPGDICIRLGEKAHTVMFLGWTDDGQMRCIQETSGNINNVEVGICTADWPYYRRLVD